MSDSATPWAGAHQAPLSMGFSRQTRGSSPPRDPGSLVRLRFGGRILYHCHVGRSEHSPRCIPPQLPPGPHLSLPHMCASSRRDDFPPFSQHLQSSQTAEPVKDISCSGGWPRGPSCYLPSTCGFNKHLLNICLCTRHRCRPWILNSRWGKISVRKWARWGRVPWATGTGMRTRWVFGGSGGG